MMAIKQFIIITIAVAIIFGGVGFWAGKKKAVQKLPAGIEKTGGDTFQSGWEAAKQRLKETGFFSASENMEMKSVSGEVTSVEGNKIALKIRPLEPLADSELDNRVALTDDQTKFTVRKNKSAEQISKEMEEYAEKAKAAEGEQERASIISPSLYSDEQGTLADVKNGLQIIVTADSDIKNEKQFKAAEIIIFEAETIETSAVQEGITTDPESQVSENSIPIPVSVSTSESSEKMELKDLAKQSSGQPLENFPFPPAGE